jgi:hypothetical protein
MRNFLLNYGSGGAKLLINSLENSPEELRELAKYTIKESKPQNQGLFGRLFRK